MSAATRALASAAPPRPLLQLPEPGRFWIRYSPRAWPAPVGAWTNLATGGLGQGARHPVVPTAWLGRDGRQGDDVWYLPPVEPARRGERDALAYALLQAGTPVVSQLAAGEPPPSTLAGAVLVHDLLEPLLAGDLAPLSAVEPGGAAVWPLIAGVTDEPALWRLGCGRLAAAGATWVQALALELSPADRRLLAAHLDERAFARLFHAPAPPERDFARVAFGFGLQPFLPRPLPRPPRRGAGNRRLAEALGLIADLWLRLGRPVGRGQAYYRAMRWLDRCSRDVEALYREGNLGVLPWLDAESRRVVEELLDGGRSRRLADLLTEYVGT